MSFAHLFRYASGLPLHVAAVKGLRWGGRIVSAYARRPFDSLRCTFADLPNTPPVLAEWAPEIPVSLLAPRKRLIARVAKRHLDHRFDLLGSGWVRVRSAPKSPPVPTPGNTARACAIRAMIGAGYEPMDWHLDFKSGYRWPDRLPSGAIRYGHEPGVDIKVPWELARLQHLPGLALAFILARRGGEDFEDPGVYKEEFRNQSLDFMAANPPGFGVNWVCPMDVAIRAANLCLALGLFRRHGARFEGDFMAEIAASLTAHGRHIKAHLEWHPKHRANHYLADICGLLFIAATLPGSPETEAWLAFSTDRLISEVERQFTPDGANFEASTCYHRLSAEMAVYATALLLGLCEGGGTPFPPWYFERLERMAEFTLHATKPGGKVVQIGDNDNGRFFNLCPVMDPETLEEDGLDHRSLVAALGGLFPRPDFLDFAGGDTALEAALIRGMAGGKTFEGTAEPLAAERRTIAGEGAEPPPGGREIAIDLPDGTVLDGLVACAYPDFGLYIWRGPRFFLSLRCGPVGQNGNGGHGHNDQLAVELQIDGEDWAADPGAYVYTPDPKTRDAYRSVLAHGAPRRGNREPARLDLGLFRLEDRAKARCLRFDERAFHGVHVGFGTPVHRTVTLGRNGDRGRIVIRDAFEGEPRQNPERITVRSPEDLKDAFGLTVSFSPGYGKIIE